MIPPFSPSLPCNFFSFLSVLSVSYRKFENYCVELFVESVSLIACLVIIRYFSLFRAWSENCWTVRFTSTLKSFIRRTSGMEKFMCVHSA